MLKAWRTFVERFRITQGVCMLLLVLSLTAVTGCSSDTAPQNTGAEAANAEKFLKGCWLCPLFEKSYDAVIGVPKSIVPSVSRSAVGLIWVGYALWLAIFILKYVSSLHEPDVGAFWKALGARTFWVVMGAALLNDLAGGRLGSAWLSFAEPVFSGFVDAGLAAVSGSSGGEVACASGGGARGGFVCLVNALQNKLNFGTGLSMVSLYMGQTMFSRFIGLIIFIFFAILMFYLPLLLLDAVFRYGIALCMLPLAVAAYVFPSTRSFTGLVAKLFMEIGFYVMIMCAFSAACVQIIGMYIERFLVFAKNPGALMGNLSALEKVVCGPGVTGLVFLCFFLVLFAGVIADFSRALSGGAGGLGETFKTTMNYAKKMTVGMASKAVGAGMNAAKKGFNAAEKGATDRFNKKNNENDNNSSGANSTNNSNNRGNGNSGSGSNSNGGNGSASSGTGRGGGAAYSGGASGGSGGWSVSFSNSNGGGSSSASGGASGGSGGSSG